MLDFRTYSAPNQAEGDSTTKEQQYLWANFDRNNIPGDERMAICYARGLSLQVFKWIRKWCIIKRPNGEIIDDLPSQHMVGLLDALLVYKSKASKRKLTGAPHCSLSMLTAQVSNVVGCDPLVEKLWRERKARSSHSLRMTLDKGCTVEWRDDAPLAILASGRFFSFKLLLRDSVFSAHQFRKEGMTAFDRKFLEGEHLRCQFEVKAVKS